MIKKCIMALLMPVFPLSLHAAANTQLTDEQLSLIQFDQKLNSQVSSALSFKDETGAAVRLGAYFTNKPTVLILGYYGCPMLCTLVLNGAADCFCGMTWKAGQEFNVVFVSIDPGESPSLAAEKKKSYVRSYGNSHAGSWHFLTGDYDSISNLATEIGFRYAYDTVAKQFAHPSGLVVLTSGGKVAHYFLGVNFAAKDVDLALRNAAQNKTGALEPPFTFLCFHYAPIHGKYGNLIMGVVRGSGILMVVILVGMLLKPSNQGKPGRAK